MPQLTTNPHLRLAVLAAGLIVLVVLPIWWNEAVAEEADLSVSSILTTYADCIEKVNELRRSAQEAHAQGRELMRAAYDAVKASGVFDTQYYELFHEASEFFAKGAGANAKALSIYCHPDEPLSNEQKFDLLGRIDDKMKNNMINDPVANFFVSNSLDSLSKSGKETFDLLGKIDHSINGGRILGMNKDIPLGNGGIGSHSLGNAHSLGTSNNDVVLGNGDAGSHSLGDLHTLGTINNDDSLGNGDAGVHGLGDLHPLGTSQNSEDSSALGVSQDLGNSSSLGEYSSMVQADTRAADEAAKELQASIPAQGSRPDASPAPEKNFVSRRPVDRPQSDGNPSDTDLKSCEKFPDRFARVFCIAKCSFKKYASDCRYIINEILPRKLYDARYERFALHCFGQRGNVAEGFRECRAQCERFYNSGFCYNKCYESDTTSESSGRSCFRGP